ncbi:MAG: hypothetical protein HUU22_01950 [Phycisphaerae bacterium]|nr:hypothetical protein [Phycisphaerae bacterium]NUQ44777.1 hypothetical protein [Phycisphaerae bacterium]
MRLFLTCWLIFAAHFATNTVREIFPALTLGDKRSFDVSEYVGFHPDLFEMPGRGAFINNNPGASIIGAVPYVLMRPIIDAVQRRVLAKRQSAGAAPPEFDSPFPLRREFFRKSWQRGYDVKFGLAAAVMQALAMAPLSAASVVLMFHVLRHRAASIRAATWLALLYAFATPVFFRTAQLNQNLLVCHCAFAAFALLWRPWDDPAVPRPPRYFWAGLLCGWSVVCDYSGVVVVAVLGIYGLVRRASLPTEARRPGDALRFLAGLSIAAAVLAGYQWACFGHPLYPAQHYMPPPNHPYKAGMTLPDPILFWRNAFGYQYGLFTSAPLLLLAFAARPAARGQPASQAGAGDRAGASLLPRREWTVCVAFTLLFLLFCCTNQYGYMQFNTGVRHQVPVTPFVFLIAAGVLLRMPRSAAVVVGVVVAWWMWQLTQYRDVEPGWGIFTAIGEAVSRGFEPFWMRTVRQMGPQFPEFVSNWIGKSALLLALAAAVACTWRVGRARAPQ